jgi:glycosyltransferase involved in cell wall biosynthesis
MRILVITETVPYPLDSGGRIKTWHTIRALAQQHETHCHAFVRDEAQRAAALGPLGESCRSVELHLLPRRRSLEAGYLARSLASGLPYTVIRHFDRDVCRRVIAACCTHQIDAVYCDHLSMFEYAVRTGLPIVYDAHNVEYRIVRRAAGHLGIDPRRLVYAREWRRLLAYETAMAARASLIFTVSDVDRDDLSAFAGPQVPVVSVPIPVSVSAMAPIEPLTDAPRVLFLGGLDWPPNADAVDFYLDEVWPRVLERQPEATFTVVGRGESALARRWGATRGVRFTGRVDNIEPWIRESRLMVAPIRAGSGMRVKILDAMARGLPVVATTVGYEGIAAEPGIHLLAGDTAPALADATLQLLHDATAARGIARAARQLALTRYDAPVIARRQLEALSAWIS